MAALAVAAAPAAKRAEVKALLQKPSMALSASQHSLDESVKDASIALVGASKLVREHNKGVHDYMPGF